MKKDLLFLATALGIVLSLSAGWPTAITQQRSGLTPEVIVRRNAIEEELQAVAIVERKLMIPMHALPKRI